MTHFDLFYNYPLHTAALSTGVLFTRRRSAVWSRVGRLAENDEPAVKHKASDNFVAGG